MSTSTGLSAQLGISVAETTYGTYVAPTTFVEFTSESLKLDKEYIRTAGIRAGRLGQSENLHVATTRSVSGGVSFDVQNKGFGKWLNLLHGDAVTPSSVGGGAYRQTHNIGTSAPDGKSATIQVGRPDVGGTVRPFSYLGCCISQAVFTLSQGGVVTVEFTIDGNDETTAQTIATASYATDSTPFIFNSGSIEFDDSVVTDCINSVKITINNPMASNRYCIGSGAVKKHPLQNGLTTVTAEVEAEFASLTQHAAFTAATRRKFELNCTGQAIGSATGVPALNFTMASTVATSSAPVVSGPDIISESITLEALDNGTDPLLVVDYTGGDSSL
jgi:hypothetical protein